MEWKYNNIFFPQRIYFVLISLWIFIILANTFLLCKQSVIIFFLIYAICYNVHLLFISRSVTSWNKNKIQKSAEIWLVYGCQFGAFLFLKQKIFISHKSNHLRKSGVQMFKINSFCTFDISLREHQSLWYIWTTPQWIAMHQRIIFSA